jgi:hypothetical protein
MSIRSKYLLATLLLSVFLRADAFAEFITPIRRCVVEVAGHPFGFAEYPWGTTVYYGWGGISVHASLFALVGWAALLAVVAFVGYLLIVRRRHANAA